MSENEKIVVIVTFMLYMESNSNQSLEMRSWYINVQSLSSSFLPSNEFHLFYLSVP
jgi:hypothetical protein